MEDRDADMQRAIAESLTLAYSQLVSRGTTVENGAGCDENVGLGEGVLDGESNCGGAGISGLTLAAANGAPPAPTARPQGFRSSRVQENSL